jgi:hypothetical protein
MAAWLASFTRLASCSWRSASCRWASARCWRFAAVLQLHVGQADGAADREQRGDRQRDQRAGAQAGLFGQPVLHFAQRPAQRLAVGNDRGLRFTRGHQALQVAQDGAGLRAGLLVQLQQCVQALAGLFVLGRGQAQLGAAIQHALGDFLERVQVLAQQEHGFRRHAFHGQELVGGFADPLGQHHQLAGGGDLGRGGVLLQLERGDRLGDFQQVGRLAVDGAQCGAHLRQDLLLAHHGLGVLLGPLHQRNDLLHV